jgi:hypothetical protein
MTVHGVSFCGLETFFDQSIDDRFVLGEVIDDPTPGTL